MKSDKYTNKLINEKSPYLLQHAHNPVNWYPWGNEAFEKAAKEDKPIFLSIGYATCHWCHVMEHESFENEAVAKLLNDAFVCIKVDREERPDIDSIYMNVCQMMTGSGGWPLTIIMTPDKKPFFAATYIPRESHFGHIGLVDLIPEVEDAWRNRRNQIITSSEKVTGAVKALSSSVPEEVDADVIKKAVKQMESRFDAVYGGFGSAPKFPSAHKLIFLMQNYYYTKNPDVLKMVKLTLERMSLGGIFDQLGYGFHRYSTDKRWLLPHFEKMLYDQAMLASAYLDGYQITGDEYFAKIAERIFTYVQRDMRTPEGAFFSAEDADSDGEEGKYYVWSADELRRLLSADEFKFMQEVFNVTDNGNFKDEASGRATGENILHLDSIMSAEQSGIFEQIRTKLLPVRIKRVHPLKDTKVLTDWNGLMIASFAKGGRVLNSEAYTKSAISAMDFILHNMFDSDKRLMHRYRDGETAIFAKLDDYAFVINALIELYETIFEPEYLIKAAELTDFVITHFKDRKNGGFFLTADYDEKLISRPKDAYDGAIPSGNSMFALNLLKLSKLTGRTEYDAEAEGIINAFAGIMNRSPESFAQMLIAYQFAENSSREIMVTGKSEDSEVLDIVNYLNSIFIPDSVIMLKTEKNGQLLEKVAPFTKAYSVLSLGAQVFVCHGESCDAPLSDLKSVKLKVK